MNICLIIRSLDVGGSQSQILELGRGLVGRGHDVCLVTFYDVKNRQRLDALFVEVRCSSRRCP